MTTSRSRTDGLSGLTGLFIRKGPVVQIKDSAGKISSASGKTATALYDGPYKLIATSRGERMLFDLAHDPGEDDDLATRQPERTAAMAERLEGLRPLGSPAAVARRE